MNRHWITRDETTLTRSLRPLKKGGWVAIRAGADRREKLVAITEAGREKLEQARPAWSKAQERMRRALPGGTWDSLFAALPDVTQAASETTSGETHEPITHRSRTRSPDGGQVLRGLYNNVRAAARAL